MYLYTATTKIRRLLIRIVTFETVVETFDSRETADLLFTGVAKEKLNTNSVRRLERKKYDEIKSLDEINREE